MNQNDDSHGSIAQGAGNGADSFEQSLKLAFEMHNAGRVEEAEALCRTLEQIRPKNSQLLFLLGMVLHKTNQDKEAVKWLSRASEFQPGSARIFNGLGCAYQGLQQHAAAAAAFERAIELEPQSPYAYYNLGKSCYRLEQIERAAALFRRAAQIAPRDFASWNNLGKCLKELNHLDESIAAYDCALEIKPDYALAHYGRAISLLTAGRLSEGFQEYEWRRHSMTPRKFPQPLWNGGQASEQTLFIHAEQGFGDAIQMVRFVKAAQRRVARVILECRPELRTLFEYQKCADAIIPYGAPIPSFDYFLPMLSLPRALGITAISSETPYLSAPVHAPLPARRGRLKVGVAWAGNPNHHQDAARSVHLRDFSPILRVPDAAFYSLQLPIPDGDKSFLASLAGALDTTLVFEDFLETASAIAQLDLVVTVDTAVAHLAGAMGKPVWLLVQHSPDWRWLAGRQDTPWYPTMILYRQATRNHWELPIARVAAALNRLTATSSVPLPEIPLAPRLAAAA